MATIRCLLHTKVQDKQTINEYMLKSGQYIKEIVTDLGPNAKRIREIYKPSKDAENVEKVVDKVFGKLEVYYPSRVGVIQEIDGIKCSIPNTTIDEIIDTVK